MNYILPGPASTGGGVCPGEVVAGGVGSLHVQCQDASCGGVAGEEATPMSGRTALAEGEHKGLLHVEGAEGHSVGDGE